MSRLLKPDHTGRMRERHRRTIAEGLALLAGKQGLDDEGRDVIAIIALSLLEIHRGIEESAGAWERRHYFLKAERLRAQWAWSERLARRLVGRLCAADWEGLCAVLRDLEFRFADVRVERITRSPNFWRGGHARLRESLGRP